MTIVRDLLLVFLTALVAYAIWYVPSWSAPPADPPAALDFLKPSVYEWFYSNRLTFIFLLFVLNSLLLALPRFNSHKNEKLYFEKVLKNVIATEFSQSLAKVRGTVFRVRGGLYTWFYYWWSCRRVFPRSEREKRVRCYYKTRKPAWNRKYLVMYARQGRPNEEKTSTFFLVPNLSKEVDSFTAFVASEEVSDYENLPDISHIDLSSYKSLDDIGSPERSLVEQYMSKGHIKFDSLRVINRLSTGLWATPLYNNRDKLWGVLIFDLERGTMRMHPQLNTRLVNFGKRLTAIVQVYF